MISVQQLDNGDFAVIDGMHRVTTLQQLLAEGHEGIDYENVNSSSSHIKSLLNRPMLGRYGASATAQTRRITSCWLLH